MLFNEQRASNGVYIDDFICTFIDEVFVERGRSPGMVSKDTQP